MAYNLNGYRVINGSARAESLSGTTGNDVIYGNGGADTLNGGTGADLLVGGAGGTRFIYSVDSSWSSGYVAVNSGDPLAAGPGTSFALSGYGRSLDVFVGTGTNNTLVMADGKNALFLDDGLSGGVDSIRLVNIQTIVTGNGNQIVDLTSSRATYGDVTITGGNGSDVLMANAGNDSLSGGNGNDYLWGGSGNDQLSGENGSDSLYGGDGNDYLDGGNGPDTMVGGAGNDTYVVDMPNDTVTESAGQGIDLVRSAVAYTLGANLENLMLTGTASINGTGNSLDNAIVGNSGNNLLQGMAGNDKINAGAGNDTAQGGEGNDQVFGEDGDDRVEGGNGNDLLNGGAGLDTLYGGAGNDGFFGGGLHDVIYGEDGDDKVYGDGGNDQIWGGRGNDILVGGQISGGFSAGNDTFLWARADVVNANGSSAGFDRITDFGAGDRLDFSAVFAGQPVRPLASEVRVTDTAAGTVVAVSVNGGSSFVDAVLIENLHGVDADALAASGALVV